MQLDTAIIMLQQVRLKGSGIYQPKESYMRLYGLMKRQSIVA